MTEYIEHKHNPRVVAQAYGLWFLTTILSVFVFLGGREAVIRTYTRFLPLETFRFQSGQGGISLINILISLPLALLVIAIVIGGFEFQHRNMGKPEGWWMLARTLSVEIAILMLTFFL